jgi:hypothetical protein
MNSLRDFFITSLRFLRLPPLSIFLFAIVSFVGYQYFQVKIYDFPVSKVFKGKELYNPYQHQSSSWLKANFHAHSKVWMGITNGNQPGDEIVRTYQDYGYDVASLSDYHHINENIYTTGNIAVPVYEHGMNINKQHHLAIGAQEVTYEDVLLWQNDHIKQFLIERMTHNSPIVCICHPGLRNGHNEQGISMLTGYNCMEVLNSGNTYTSYWDAALSAGRPVWMLANDDNHDTKKQNIVISWNLIQAPALTQENVINALKFGNTLGVRRKIPISNLDSLRVWALKNNGNILKRVITKDTTVTYIFTNKVNETTLIGQSGKVIASFKNADSITYTFSEADTYVRVEADTGPLKVYLNPVLRYDGTSAPQNVKLATVNFSKTLLLRITVILLYLTVFQILFPTFLRWLLYGQSSKTQYEQAIS